MNDAMANFSACIEMLFVPESGDPSERIRLAAQSGFRAIEFWHWMNKDLDAIEAAQQETGLTITGFVAEPVIPLVEASNHDGFLQGLEQSVRVAERLGAKVLIAQSGDDIPGKSRAAQRDDLVLGLAKAAHVLRGTGVRLALEPLNTLIDHQGYFLESTAEALDIVDEVGRPEVRILYDVYHSMVMGEEPSAVLDGRVDRIAHIHIADHPGRNQPGSGKLDLRGALSWLRENGYTGWAGLEYRPTEATWPSVEDTRRYFGGL